MVTHTSPRQEIGGSKLESNYSKNSPSKRSGNHLSITKSPRPTSKFDQMYFAPLSSDYSQSAAGSKAKLGSVTSRTLNELGANSSNPLELDLN